MLEKIIQEHLFKHLWILDPSWERATETGYMEQSVTEEFNKINAHLTPDERKGRLDIKYTSTSKKHVIVELKKADRTVTSTELIDQTSKYLNALRKLLNEAGREGEPTEVVCIVGKDLRDWKEIRGREESKMMLASKNIRVVLYKELIDNAYKAYQAFIIKKKEAGRVLKLIRTLEGKDFHEHSR